MSIENSMKFHCALKVQKYLSMNTTYKIYQTLVLCVYKAKWVEWLLPVPDKLRKLYLNQAKQNSEQIKFIEII